MQSSHQKLFKIARYSFKIFSTNLTQFWFSVRDILSRSQVITSTGPATGLDVAFKLLEMLTSTKNVAEGKKYMRFTNK